MADMAVKGVPVAANKIVSIILERIKEYFVASIDKDLAGFRAVSSYNFYYRTLL